VRNLTTDSVVYGAGSIAIKVIGFLLIPIYSSYLTPAAYGALALVTMFGSFVALAIGLGQHTAIFRFYFKYPAEDPRRGAAISSFLAIIAAMAVPCALLASASKPIARVLMNDGGLALLILMMIAINYLDLVEKVPLVLIRARRLATRYSAYSLIRTVTTISLILLFVVVLKLGAKGVLLGQLISGVLFTVLLYAIFMRGQRPSWDREVGPAMLRFGLPLVPGLVLFSVFQYANRYFLQEFKGIDAVGQYALGSRFGEIIALMNTAIQTAWPVFLYESESDERAPELYARAMTYYLAVAGSIAAALTVFSPEVYALMVHRTFAESIVVVPYVAVAYVFMGVYQFGAVGINLKEKTNYYMIITGAAAVVSVVANIVLIPRWGIVGAAAATLLAFATQAIASQIIAQRFYRVPYEWRRILTLVAVLVVTASAARALPGQGTVSSLALKAALLVLFVPAMLWVSRFFAPDERQRLIAILRRRKA